jgi:hypothetical protein
MSSQGPLHPLKVKWSPDGRYLAMTTSVSRPGEFMVFSHLAVLDTFTGEIYQPELGMHYVEEIQWMPDSKHLTTLGIIGLNRESFPIQNLALVNVTERGFRIALPDYDFGGESMVLSSDGATLAVRCPAAGKDRLCLVSVTNPGGKAQ